MPNFSRPFPQGIKLRGAELLMMIYQSMADEHEAAMRYRLIADATDNEDVKAAMRSVADEEIVHFGEFRELVKRLFPDELAKVEQGIAEANEYLDKPAKAEDVDEEAKEHGIEEAAKTPQGDAKEQKRVFKIVSK